MNHDRKLWRLNSRLLTGEYVDIVERVGRRVVVHPRHLRSRVSSHPAAYLSSLIVPNINLRINHLRHWTV